MEPIRVFVSHSSRDRIVVGKLAEVMKKFHIEPFLAHIDIEGGESWREEIHKQIQECHILVALVTPNFHRSKFTEQEVGAAWGLEKPILSICVDEMIPTGFAAERQRERYNANRPHKTAGNIMKFALSEIYGKERVVGMAVEMLAKSASWEESDYLANILINAKDLTVGQLKTIDSALQLNFHVKTTPEVRDNLVDLLNRYETQTQDRFLELYHEHETYGV